MNNRRKKLYFGDKCGVVDIEQRIKELEEEIKRTQYNKATEKHILRLKARIAYLRKELEERKKKQRAQTKKGVKKSGDAMVSIIGPPSVGKSMLFNLLTNAKSEVGDYAFTTLEVHPGILKYRGAEIQILDMPGLIEGASYGRGNGREILSIARNSDLIMLMVDIFTVEYLETVMRELHNFGIRINQKPPQITVKKKDRGGINIASTIPLSMDREDIAAILREFGYINADVLIKEDINPERLMDFLSGNKAYVPALLLVNKVDLADKKLIKEINEKLEKWKPLFISAKNGHGIEKLKERIFQESGLIRIYLKPQSGKVDYDAPLILKRESTIEDVCNALHRDFVRKFRYAMVWGRSVKFPGQHVGLDHKLEDEDVVRLVIRR